MKRANLVLEEWDFLNGGNDRGPTAKEIYRMTAPGRWMHSGLSVSGTGNRIAGWR